MTTCLSDWKRGFCSMAIFLCASGSATEAKALTLAENGAARAVIVVADEATEPEKYAARELAAFLKQVTGSDFGVASKAEGPLVRLLVGPDAAKLVDPAFSTDGLGGEGLVLRTVGNDLILAGGRPRGTLYAVYTFLTDQVGCRWWSPTVSAIPRHSTLEVNSVNTRFVPKLEYREPFWFSAFDGDWAARNRCNGPSERLDATHGGKHVVEGFVHTFFPLIPPDRYFKDHPEWFSEIGGQRKCEQAQLCLTNEAMRQELVKNLKERLRSNPTATIASVSQNDWHGSCQCATCKAIDEEEGSPSGAMLRFVNAVAADVEKDFPHVTVSTLAYQYTRQPPKITRPRANVSVWLCSIECSFSKPLTDERNRKFREDIEGWSKICNRLYVWDYTTNFRHYVLPHPNVRVLGPNIRFFVDHNVKGIFEQGAYHTWGAEMMELRAWVLAQMLWDPSRDPRKLIDEFLTGYYGPAAPRIRDYLELIHDAVDATGDRLGCFSDLDAKFLSFDTLSKGLACLKAAESAAGNDSDLRLRVQVAQLPVFYAYLLKWKALRDEAQTTHADWPVADSRQALYARFMEIAKAVNVTHAAESRKIDWLKAQVEAP